MSAEANCPYRAFRPRYISTKRLVVIRVDTPEPAIKLVGIDSLTSGSGIRDRLPCTRSRGISALAAPVAYPAPLREMRVSTLVSTGTPLRFNRAFRAYVGVRACLPGRCPAISLLRHVLTALALRCITMFFWCFVTDILCSRVYSNDHRLSPRVKQPTAVVSTVPRVW